MSSFPGQCFYRYPRWLPGTHDGCPSVALESSPHLPLISGPSAAASSSRFLSFRDQTGRLSYTPLAVNVDIYQCQVMRSPGCGVRPEQHKPFWPCFFPHTPLTLNWCPAQSQFTPPSPIGSQSLRTAKSLTARPARAQHGGVGERPHRPLLLQKAKYPR